MDQNNLVLMVVDYQERLIPALHEGELAVERARMFIEAMKIFELPIIVTEQYPKGLGKTVAEIKEVLPLDTSIYEKTQFSAYTEAVKQVLESLGKKHVVIIGVETHVCVFQTVRDLLEKGYEVTVIVDTVTSRFEQDRLQGLRVIEKLGGSCVTSEMFIYDLLKDAKNPVFKEILKIVK